MKQTTKSGFTLVELSIVLVIIGLLIGGILVGQSLIESAKMQSFIRQVGQYDAAVGVFKDKFGNLPGDNGLFGTTLATAANLGNGIITDNASVIAAFNGEIGAFWADLSASGLKSEDTLATYTALRTNETTAPTLGTHMPQAKVGTNAGIYAYGINGRNYYYVGSNSASTMSFTSSLKPADVLAIDSKIDDGAPSTGTVIGIANATTALVAVDTGTLVAVADGTPAAGECLLTAPTLSGANVTVSGTYNASVASDLCKVAIRMGASTGVLQ